MEDEGGKFLGLLFAVAWAVFMFIIGPFVLIWAVSKLWDVAAVYDFWHWLAGLLLVATLGRASSGKSK